MEKKEIVGDKHIKNDNETSWQKTRNGGGFLAAHRECSGWLFVDN